MLILKFLPLTEDLIVDLQEICLQHLQLLVLHLYTSGYALRLLFDKVLLVRLKCITEDLSGDRRTRGPL